MNLTEANLQCEEIIKANSRSFYAAFKVLPKAKRQAVFAVYAFCRIVDDAIDVQHDVSILDGLVVELDKIQANQNTEHFVFIALQDAINQYNIPYLPFYEMIEGQRLDSVFIQSNTEDQFLRYCYLVAGTVGLMLLPILGHRSSVSLEPMAIHLGYAMQITNVLRDIGEDYQMARVYLPKTSFTQYPKAIDAIQHQEINSDFIQLWESWAKKAEYHYKQSFRYLSKVDHDSYLPLISAIFYYREILKVIRKAGYDSLTQRQSVKNYLQLNLRVRTYQFFHTFKLER
ncbi:MAG: phytoene/squalene synthase family protein [Erysipelotrichaceae bacterium]